MDELPGQPRLYSNHIDMKKNPWGEPQTALCEESVEVVYSDGSTFAVLLRELDIPMQAAIPAKGEEYKGMFVGYDAQGHPKVFMSPDGQRVTLTEDFCDSAAAIELMQAQAERYTFPELVGLAIRMKDEYRKIAIAAARVQSGGNALDPPAAGAGPSSAPASTTASPTPPSPGSSGTPSGASTNGSGRSAGGRARKRKHSPASTSPAPLTTT